VQKSRVNQLGLTYDLIAGAFAFKEYNFTHAALRLPNNAVPQCNIESGGPQVLLL
jgi:hypothetical protein